ncbi:hypothetical protein DL765_001795 [Monosporascus sp. GIB2]|nr:hypothetical protein DL765_001795 [Monosporascus sp. GIB2]
MAPFFRNLLFGNGLFAVAIAAVVPRTPDNFEVNSVLDPGVSLSFKETSICETTPGVKSYSGYVNIPANPEEGRDFDIHSFFWFFEARKDPANAPLALWLQGGPGSPSIPAAIGENGPCDVTPDSKGTTLNSWSWNNEVNMLYLDQPVQTGFSYDKIINGTIDETSLPYYVTPAEKYENLNHHTLAGKFSSQDPRNTTPTTGTAALAAWHFMQIWMKEFPKYKPNDRSFSIWGESYAGHYAPTFSDFFLGQNNKIADGSLDSSAIPLHLDTVGLVNACIDITTQMPFYPEFAFNNTYGLQIINETAYKAAVDAWPACKSKIETCRTLEAMNDPEQLGNDEEVNEACADAYKSCFATMQEPYQPLVNNVFDVTATIPGSFPPKYAAGYLNNQTIQEELGVRVNFTGLSTAASTAFPATGDFVRGRNLEILGELLDSGVKVALMYGDRDYQCNWLGGEAISLAIKSKLSAAFRKAGYAEIRTNDDYVGGMVRQHGNLSFARVFNAGHEVPYYQPETAYEIFMRVTANKDVATGKVKTSDCGSKYSTKGQENIFAISNDLPTPHKQECYFWDMFETCEQEQIKLAKQGSAIFEDFIMTGYRLDNGTVVRF